MPCAQLYLAAVAPTGESILLRSGSVHERCVRRWERAARSPLTAALAAHAFVTYQLDTTSASLSTLRQDLKAYGDKLRTQLIDLLNRDYKDFISLSSNLVGCGPARSPHTHAGRRAHHTRVAERASRSL
jgi:hypothetical protein